MEHRLVAVRQRITGLRARITHDGVGSGRAAWRRGLDAVRRADLARLERARTDLERHLSAAPDDERP